MKRLRLAYRLWQVGYGSPRAAWARAGAFLREER